MSGSITGWEVSRIGSSKTVVYAQVLTNDQVFGYAVTEALRAAKQTNVGLRDQRAAFDCRYRYFTNELIFELMKTPGVHDNIEAFGGNPENVVAVGQSVGAMAIDLHLVSYSGTQGVPFQKAM